jgi:hypothetical protein
MIRSLFLMLALCIAYSAHALDASDKATEISRRGNWQIIEFAGAKQLIYRLSSTSIDGTEKHVVFDFVPSLDCSPTPAVMIVRFNSYNPVFNEGMLPLAFKLPSQSQEMELTKTTMSEGDTFAFFAFEKLSVATILKSQDKGKLAVWIPPSGDGRVKRTDNIYFSLEGFASASKEAKRLCRESK